MQTPNLKDVMQQLLPAEQAASKPTPKEPSSTPNGAPKGSPHGDKQQAQRASSTAKASTPKRQDQVTTRPAGAKSGDKDKDKERQERDRSHSARREPARSHPVSFCSPCCKPAGSKHLCCKLLGSLGGYDLSIAQGRHYLPLRKLALCSTKCRAQRHLLDSVQACALQ